LAGFFLNARFFQARSGTLPFFWPGMPMSNNWPKPMARAAVAMASGPIFSAVW
jgi:hypothetical protein